MSKWGWDSAHAKSWGNGVLRISLMDLVKLLTAAIVVVGAWRDLKNAVNSNSGKTDVLITSVSNLEEQQQLIANRVLVLETIEKTTRGIKASVNQLKNEEIFDHDVKIIKKKR